MKLAGCYTSWWKLELCRTHLKVAKLCRAHDEECLEDRAVNGEGREEVEGKSDVTEVEGAITIVKHHALEEEMGSFGLM